VTSDVLCRAHRLLVIRAHPSGFRRSGLTHSAFASRVSPNQHAPCARPTSARRLVKDGCLREPGRLPSTSAPSTRPSRAARSRIAPQTHNPLVLGLDGSPPPFSQLCRREPASDARSPFAPVKEERLDLPPSGGMGQAPLVDFCNQNTPRARPLDRLNPDSARLGDCALRARPGGARSLRQPLVVECYFAAPAAPLEQDPEHAGTALAGLASSGGALPCGTAPAEVSRARDQGAFARPAPSAAIARDGSFAPTRSARTPRVASSSRRRPEKPPPRTHAQ
jgi:hypothetical protein